MSCNGCPTKGHLSVTKTMVASLMKSVHSNNVRAPAEGKKDSVGYSWTHIPLSTDYSS